jgi:hypothetical protein
MIHVGIHYRELRYDVLHHHQLAHLANWVIFVIKIQIFKEDFS